MPVVTVSPRAAGSPSSSPLWRPTGPARGDRIALGDQLVDGHANVAERQIVEQHQLAEGVA